MPDETSAASSTAERITTLERERDLAREDAGQAKAMRDHLREELMSWVRLHSELKRAVIAACEDFPDYEEFDTLRRLVGLPGYLENMARKAGSDA